MGGWGCDIIMPCLWSDLYLESRVACNSSLDDVCTCMCPISVHTLNTTACSHTSAHTHFIYTPA